MRIESLKYLIDFAKTGSVSGAAAKNYMSEQGMGRVFRQLEKELGVTLFYRNGKSLRLTEAGESIVERSRSLVCDYESLQDIVSFYTDQAIAEEKDFYLYGTPLSMLCFMPLFDIQRPGLFPFAVNIREKDLSRFSENEARIVDDDAIGIASVPLGPIFDAAMEDLHSKGLDFRGIYECEVGALVSSSTPLASMDFLPYSRYKERSKGAVGVACPNDSAVTSQLAAVIDNGNMRIISNNIALIEKSIRRGQVVMFLPKLILASLDTGNGIAYIPTGNIEGGGASKVRFGAIVPQDCVGKERCMLVAHWIESEVERQLRSTDVGAYAECIL